MAHRRIPKFRCYKPKNLGTVVIGGRQHYLGPYGFPESVAEYNRQIQESLSRGSPPATCPRSTGDHLSINELVLAFLTEHAQTHYRRVAVTAHAAGSPNRGVYPL
jgi:hypothetical protein